ncbi:DoxX family membrane protein [bacterium]|nr:DoxX family membrane protein [bacterium]
MDTIKRWGMHPASIFVFRLIIGATFMYASYYKILDPHDFARSIYNYRIVPASLINIMAVILPWIEMVCGIMLIMGLFMRENAFILTVMLLVFSVAIVSVMVRGIDTECGCFKKNGVETQQVISSASTGNTLLSDKAGYPLLIRDLIMVLMGLAIFVSKPSACELDFCCRKRTFFFASEHPA